MLLLETPILQISCWCWSFGLWYHVDLQHSKERTARAEVRKWFIEGQEMDQVTGRYDPLRHLWHGQLACGACTQKGTNINSEWPWRFKMSYNSTTLLYFVKHTPCRYLKKIIMLMMSLLSRTRILWLFICVLEPEEIQFELDVNRWLRWIDADHCLCISIPSSVK
jgi:hypothetical protein